MPTISNTISALLGLNPLRKYLTTFRPEAPSIMGIAIKNENSELASLEAPTSIPPRIVDPDRDVPGINDRT